MQNNRLIIGIDPGVNGGWAFRDNKGIRVFSFESTCDTRIAFDNAKILKSIGDYEYIQAYLEEADGNIRIAGKLSFAPKLARNLGFYEGLCVGLEIPLTLVRAKTWQKGLSGVEGLTGQDRKRKLKDIAAMQFPDTKPTLKTCDAILIADYGWRQTQ